MRIGVTGIYASGKGTVCSMFEKLGAIVIDTDIIAREIVNPPSPVLDTLVHTFGHDILNTDGTLNRRYLAQKVFNDKMLVEKLNSITHPAILQEVMQRSHDSSKIYMINTPLLFETEYHKHMDKNIVVVANTEQVLKRGVIRDGITEDEIKARLNHQISLKEKMKLADYIIDNSGSLENTKKQVEELWKTLILMKGQ
ncbi:MAG TPA: dephospho-CoA kinase [Spirochaetota bacterium]|nr:dephospho-CoA kinase [Spirochaetota bacterium]HOM09242.1 dephospho-CoA kinase [Spirochaetota bacterium]HPP49042.1 dephospho-CoA kinase [Spirochaetota bacterium]HXK65710.1 dephospho-CoA kinase [Spirochaetota bacterium]